MGKARVAPLKKITIPRLELTAATVAVRMNRMLEEELDIKNTRIYFWTDSTSTIKYCANETSQFHTFVANRINIIREGSDSKQWKYVDTKSNPADDASRGLTVDKFLQNKRWLRGPDLLWKRENEWPAQQDISRALCNKDPEVKREASVYSTVLVEQEFGVEKILLRYSSMMKLKKIVGWFLLAKKNLQDKCRKRKEGDEDTNADTSQKSCETTIPPVSLENLQRAEDAIMKCRLLRTTEVKRGRVTEKRYGAIFTCMATRAVHLEVACSLDTDSCINAIRRFIARRGQVRSIRSDNGTNFVAADKELKESIRRWNQEKIAEMLHQQDIKWEFNPKQVPTLEEYGSVTSEP
ncbi:uncharacterized protein [Ptychodera flava]|uniref:uncharacterized protein n=1 Tax=Ptychodera flava TaxID=63121 RepID=UPI00396A9C27